MVSNGLAQHSSTISTANNKYRHSSSGNTGMDTENPSTNQWGFISPAVLLPAATSAHKHTPHAWNTLLANPQMCTAGQEHAGLSPLNDLQRGDSTQGIWDLWFCLVSQHTFHVRGRKSLLSTALFIFFTSNHKPLRKAWRKSAAVAN